MKTRVKYSQDQNSWKKTNSNGKMGKSSLNILTLKIMFEFLNINLNQAQQLTHQTDFFINTLKENYETEK